MKKNKNKNKVIFSIVTTFCLMLSAMFIFTACGEHKHSFSSEWTRDTEYHWHACSGEECTEKSEYKKHDYSSDIDPICDTCGYERTFDENIVTCENKISKTYRTEMVSPIWMVPSLMTLVKIPWVGMMHLPTFC